MSNSNSIIAVIQLVTAITVIQLVTAITILQYYNYNIHGNKQIEIRRKSKTNKDTMNIIGKALFS